MVSHSATSSRKLILIAFLFSLVIHSIGAYYFPVTQDEAYYFYWARFPDLGYFDHPPMIAWLAALGPALGLGDSVFSFRFGGLITATLFFPLSISLFLKLGLRRLESLLAAVVVVNFNLAALVFGFINTPDLPLVFFWLLALHEAVSAIKGQPSRWLTAGLATGLGIQSKYSMLLIGLVFLYGLWRSKGGLRSIWPYLGGVVCVLSLLPHLWWSQQNDWVSLRFQIGRGFLSQYDLNTQLAAQLPATQVATADSKEYQLAESFRDPSVIEKPRPPRSEWERRISRIGSFIGGQIGLWGLLAPVIGWQYFRWRRERGRYESSAEFDRAPTFGLLAAATFVPLIVFGIISPFQHIEANWPAIYLIGAAAWLGSRRWVKWPALAWASLLNIAVLLLLIVHSHYPLSKDRPSRDRILRETHGYQNLANHLAQLNSPIMGDTYQTISLVKFYQPTVQVGQWPGYTRISELVRRQEMVPYSWHDLNRGSGFYFLTEQRVPPIVAGFAIDRLWELSDCLDGKFEVREALLGALQLADCEKRVHRWSLAFYRQGN